MIASLVRTALAGLFLMAGIAHFQHPQAFMKIVPPQLPSPRFLVYLSGVVEILGGVGILWPATRVASGWLLVALLLAVFPANVYMATSGVKFGSFPSQPWMAWARLPFQFVLIALVVWACELLPGIFREKHVLRGRVARMT